MSLDVYLFGPEEEVEKHCHCCDRSYLDKERECFYEANITHNLNRMAEAAGIYKHLWRPHELGISKAGDLIAPLKEGLAKLEAEPEKYGEYNPVNGWGNYRNLVSFVEDYITACENHPDADISACP